MLLGLGVLTVNLMAFSGFRGTVGSKAYAALVVYSEVPLVVVCMFMAGLLVRSRPIVLGLIYAGLLFVIHLIWTPIMAGCLHFWIRSVVNVGAAIGGTYLAMAVARRAGERQPMHPIYAGAITLSGLVLTWLCAWCTVIRGSLL